MIDHISYSAIKTWYDCPFFFKLKEIDKVVSSDGSIFTAFGNGIHKVCETLVKVSNSNDLQKIFSDEFRSKLKEISVIQTLLKEDKNQTLIKEMMLQAKGLFPEILPALKEKFGDYKSLVTEKELWEPMTFSQLKFKGFVDLVLYTPQTDMYHLIDWKSCSWGWRPRKKSDKVIGYQLALYKHFFAQYTGVNPDQIETYFALLKRTGKTGKKVEIFRVTSGKKKTENALEWVRVPTVNIEKGFFPKKSSSCSTCSIRHSEWCP